MGLDARPADSGHRKPLSAGWGEGKVQIRKRRGDREKTECEESGEGFLLSPLWRRCVPWGLQCPHGVQIYGWVKCPCAVCLPLAASLTP